MDKIYCGNGKAFNTQYGEILNVSLDLDKLNAEFSNFGFTTQAGKRMIKIKVTKRQAADNYGNTHSVIVDVWKPEKKNQQNTGNAGQTFTSDPIDDSDVPF